MGLFRQNMKKLKILKLSRDSRYLQKLALKRPKQNSSRRWRGRDSTKWERSGSTKEHREPENANPQTPWSWNRQVLTIFEPSFLATCSRKFDSSYQGVQTGKEQESGRDWVENIEQQEHKTDAAANSKGTSGGHDSNNSRRTKWKPFRRIEVRSKDCRKQGTGDCSKEFEAVPFRPLCG